MLNNNNNYSNTSKISNTTATEKLNHSMLNENTANITANENNGKNENNANNFFANTYYNNASYNICLNVIKFKVTSNVCLYNIGNFDGYSSGRSVNYYYLVQLFEDFDGYSLISDSSASFYNISIYCTDCGGSGAVTYNSSTVTTNGGSFICADADICVGVSFKLFGNDSGNICRQTNGEGAASCYSAIVSGFTNITGSGSQSLINANITSNIYDNGTMKIVVTDNNSYGWTVTCSVGDICEVWCDSSNACSILIGICLDNDNYDQCYAFCDESNGMTCQYDCNNTWNCGSWSTKVPTTIPTRMRSLLPSAQPSRLILPITIPKLSPTDNNETVTIDGTDYQLISGDDITWISIEGDTFGESGSYFNPGFKNSLVSTIEISLNNEATVKLVESWINGESNVHFTMTIQWLVSNSTDSNNVMVMSLDYTDMNVTEYDEEEFTIYSSENGSHFISSYYTLYSHTSVKRFGGFDICNAFDESNFKSGASFLADMIDLSNNDHNLHCMIF